MIDVLRAYAPALAWLRSVENETVVLPGYVAMELIQGCQSKAELRALRKELEDYSIIWPKPETCGRAMRLFGDIHLSHSTGLLDTLIGMTAVEHDVPLHTFNEKHYRPIPELETVRPYEREH